MAATSVPQLVAYAQGVGYASYRGLATAGPSLLAWGLATGSPFMSCGVTSITALMAKADLDGESYVAAHGEEEYVKLVAAYSMWVGLCSALLGIVGFGKLAGMVPSNVRKGFKVRLVEIYIFMLVSMQISMYKITNLIRSSVGMFGWSCCIGYAKWSFYQGVKGTQNFGCRICICSICFIL